MFKEQYIFKAKIIQIQHLLKLNSIKCNHQKKTKQYSNTTLVKVKCNANTGRFFSCSIQIQHLLKLNNQL